MVVEVPIKLFKGYHFKGYHFKGYIILKDHCWFSKKLSLVTNQFICFPARNFLNHIPETGPPIPAYYEVVNTDMAYVAGYATGDYGAVYNYPLYFVLKERDKTKIQLFQLSIVGIIMNQVDQES